MSGSRLPPGRRDKVWRNTIRTDIMVSGDLGPEVSNSEVDPVIVVLCLEGKLYFDLLIGACPCVFIL